MKSIQLGLLLPTSSIIPMGKDFEKGLKEVIAAHQLSTNIDIIKEHIGQGSLSQTETAINKLLSYEDADVVTGILSNKLAENFSLKFNASKKPFIINNVGENIPRLSMLNDYTFTSSLGLWQHAWALGYWGVKTIGKKGMYVSSVYDAGYQYSQMFYEGMMAADQTSTWSFSVAPMPPKGALTDMNIFFPYIEKYEPDFIFATFCGEETTLFLNEFIARGWHKKIKILGLPFLLDPLEALNDDVIVYTTLPSIEDTALQVRNAFYFLGKQTAEIICQAMLQNDNNLYEGLKQYSKLNKVNDTFFVQHSVNSENNIAIVKNEIASSNAGITSAIVDKSPAYPLSNLQQTDNGEFFGWNNPYLCV